jgi:trehalose synthase
MVAGPELGTISDDPEGAEAFAAVRRAWERLSATARRHVHVASLPMEDPLENARLVNALQRHAAVVTQKSVREGFGLTVAEAMWKERPVVATRVGGIQDQILHGESGLLVDDPHDLGGFADAVTTLLQDSKLAVAMGGAARERVCERFLPAHHFAAEASLFERITV